MEKKALSFSLLILSLFICLSVAHNARPLPYQAHSMNDLNLTLQELIKGTSNFKFDVSLATQESCENHSSWSGEDSECGFNGYGLKTCCLALRGDCSEEPVFTQTFNTTEDMLSFITNPKYAFIFSHDTTVSKYAETKYFAFNF